MGGGVFETAEGANPNPSKSAPGKALAEIAHPFSDRLRAGESERERKTTECAAAAAVGQGGRCDAEIK